jgi:hypothetical protein
VLADNIQDATYEKLQAMIPKDRIVRLNYGSGGITFLHAALMVKDAPIAGETVVYFVEDDYIHTAGSLQKLLEGLHIDGVEYVTGYDHPDKYMQPIQPTISSELHVTKSCHWRTTTSTTMTFATYAKVVRDDYEVYQRFCKTGYPFDHEMFCALRRKGRTLLSSIPGFCTHAELAWLSPHVDWQAEIKKYTET